MTATLQPKQKPSARAAFDENAFGHGMITFVCGLESEDSLTELDLPVDQIDCFNDEDYLEYNDGDIRYGCVKLQNGKGFNIFHDCGLNNIAGVIRHMIMRARAGQYAHYKDYNPDGSLKDDYESLPHRPDPIQASKDITREQSPTFFNVNHKPHKGRYSSLR